MPWCRIGCAQGRIVAGRWTSVQFALEAGLEQFEFLLLNGELFAALVEFLRPTHLWWILVEVGVGHVVIRREDFMSSGRGVAPHFPQGREGKGGEHTEPEGRYARPRYPFG